MSKNLLPISEIRPKPCLLCGSKKVKGSVHGAMSKVQKKDFNISPDACVVYFICKNCASGNIEHSKVAKIKLYSMLPLQAPKKTVFVRKNEFLKSNSLI